MTSLRCNSCGAIWLSEAGHSVVQKGERCLSCDGELTVADRVEHNVATVRQAWENLLAGDIDGLVEQHHPEAEVHSMAGHPSGDARPAFRGHTGVRRCIEECRGACEAEPHELRGFGDRVLTLGNLLRKDGSAAVHPVAWIFHLREGKIVSLHVYLNPADALRELRPEPSG